MPFMSCRLAVWLLELLLAVLPHVALCMGCASPHTTAATLSALLATVWLTNLVRPMEGLACKQAVEAALDAASPRSRYMEGQEPVWHMSACMHVCLPTPAAGCSGMVALWNMHILMMWSMC